MSGHHPAFSEMAKELESLLDAERLNADTFNALIAKARAAGLTKTDCFPLYQCAALYKVVQLSDHFPSRGPGYTVPSPTPRR